MRRGRDAPARFPLDPWADFAVMCGYVGFALAGVLMLFVRDV
jgi:hypothetical protein